jgi:hypothetical protein
MSRRKTLLAGEIPQFDVQDDAVDDDEEKRRRISGIIFFNIYSIYESFIIFPKCKYK